MSCIMICIMIFYNNFLQIFNEKQELFYSVLLYFCDSVFVFQCLCFLVIVQKCVLVQFSHDLPMAKWQNCRWRRMAKLAQWAKWANGQNGPFSLLQFWAQNTKQNKKTISEIQTIEMKWLLTYIIKKCCPIEIILKCTTVCWNLNIYIEIHLRSQLFVFNL